ncbi:MAG TPA: hypothetical protein VHZ54_10430 [Solirubrobacterales bacterium]|jgi:hypothetical protein|nr:hypothetical protein [Solirubrobacterales bacterium]
MGKLKRGRPSAGVVLGTLALIVAVAGNAGAFAGTKVIVRKGQIAKGAVTAKTLGAGAVHPKALAPGAVTAAAIKGGAVGGAALAPDSVSGGALAPGSVYGGALGEVTLHSAAIVDIDTVPHNGEWTPSQPAVATCGMGERVLSGGVVFTEPGNGQVGIVTTQPFVNGGAQGWAGRITTDSGGTAKAEAQVLCLK